LHPLQDQFQKQFKVGKKRCQIIQLHKILRMMSCTSIFYGYLWTHNLLLTQTWKNKVGDQGIKSGSTSQPQVVDNNLVRSQIKTYNVIIGEQSILQNIN
jgi:hypothetical protein